MKLESLKLIAEEAAACTKCTLHQSRIKSVFARGNPDAQIVFLGEAAGEQENLSGSPFVGRAGRLLDNMIKAMGLDRDQDVYICNTVKCRPPNNRKPFLEEMESCRTFLTRQLDVVKPKVIVALGASATEALLGPGLGISKRRGIWSTYNDILVLPTFHPSYCLRNPSSKKEVAEDLTEVLRYLKEHRDK